MKKEKKAEDNGYEAEWVGYIFNISSVIHIEEDKVRIVINGLLGSSEESQKYQNIVRVRSEGKNLYIKVGEDVSYSSTFMPKSDNKFSLKNKNICKGAEGEIIEKMKRNMDLSEKDIKYDLFCTECEQPLVFHEEGKSRGCLNLFLVVVGLAMGIIPGIIMIVYLARVSKVHCRNCGAGHDELVPITSAKAKRLMGKRGKPSRQSKSQKSEGSDREIEDSSQSEISDTEKIDKYHELFKKGAITKEEYERKKKDIIE